MQLPALAGELFGWGFFNRRSGEFSSGVDKKFTVTGDAWSIPATEWIIVRAMVTRPKGRVNAEADRGHEQKENNPLRTHGMLTYLPSIARSGRGLGLTQLR